jgi:small nuclear ribonucleoprotein
MVMPQNLLEKSVGRQVSVLLKDGRLIEGTLQGYDEYMNMVMESSSETAGETKRILGTVIVRGNNVLSISPQA